jgi:hypothetical protein
MVVIGDYRQQAELRKRRRKPLHYAAWIVIGPTAQPRKCMLSDISDTGARLTGIQEDLPQEFLLLLSKDGSPRRRCRKVWRDGDRIGVEFIRPAPAPTRRRMPSP